MAYVGLRDPSVLFSIDNSVLDYLYNPLDLLQVLLAGIPASKAFCRNSNRPASSLEAGWLQSVIKIWGATRDGFDPGAPLHMGPSLAAEVPPPSSTLSVARCFLGACCRFIPSRQHCSTSSLLSDRAAAMEVSTEYSIYLFFVLFVVRLISYLLVCFIREIFTHLVRYKPLSLQPYFKIVHQAHFLFGPDLTEALGPSSGRLLACRLSPYRLTNERMFVTLAL
jgi:hypothetical protein